MSEATPPGEFPSRRSLRGEGSESEHGGGAAQHERRPDEPQQNEPQPSEPQQNEPQLVEPLDDIDAQPAPTGGFAAPVAARTATESVRVKQPYRRRRAIALALVIAVPLALVGGVVGLAWGPISSFLERFQEAEDYSGPGTGDLVFQIAPGDTGESIAANLYEQGVTASFDAFYELVLATSPEPVFQPGSYALKQKMSAQAALDALLDPANRMQSTLLIREGETQAEVFAMLEAEFGFDPAELEALGSDPASFGLPAQAVSLEGFLFPATYTFDPGVTARDVLTTLINRSFQALDEAGVPVEERWDIIVMASLVQKEARLSEDFFKVARVFYNRLDPAQWPLGLLQSDATVHYGAAVTGRTTTTNAERADAENPYNTYVHPGQIIAPISNPGDLAIAAARNPADGPWLYFVTWNLATGETIFSSTLAEHEAGVAKWLQWMKENPEYQ